MKDVTEPRALSFEIRRRMQTTRQTQTGPELAIRSALDGSGLQYETDRRAIPSLRCRPDIMFSEYRLAIFVDGCFWHSCPVHGTMPKHNAEWWREKLAANRRRDDEAVRALRDHGWQVLRFWEHDDPVTAAETVLVAIAGRETVVPGRHPASG